ncbi:DUF2304 domain-containing protein [Gryllotalpicola reticulitermitis]|uniref:DUF2304 domain-containing protein n=1 Tax=Gryllotalpicola reticulitermitis TaxID=1184153 RepID=A0ABV8Q7Z3_9MICO
MESQPVIKVILIIVFVAFGVFLMLPGRGARHLAIRRLLMVLVLALTVLAVIFPNALNQVAHAVGVGRGADLLLYGLIVVFVGNALVQQRRSRHTERQITLIARRLALAEARLAAGPTAEIAGPAAESRTAGNAAAAAATTGATIGADAAAPAVRTASTGAGTAD